MQEKARKITKQDDRRKRGKRREKSVEGECQLAATLGPSHHPLNHLNESMLGGLESVLGGTLYSAGAAEDALTESGSVLVDSLVRR